MTNAQVTQEDRKVAFACVWTDTYRPHELTWIETGQGFVCQRCIRVAQALANARAQGLAEARREHAPR